MQRFMIFTAGRTGSTAIGEELNSHPGITMHVELARLDPAADQKTRELLHVHGMGYHRHGHHDTGTALHIFKGDTAPATARQVSAWFDHLVQAEPSVEAVGVKVLEVHLPSFVSGLRTLAEAGVKALYLQRRNSLRQVISLLVAQQVGSYNGRIPPAQGRRFTVSADTIIARIRRAQRRGPDRLQELESAGVSTLPIYYEDFLQDRASFYAPIFDFLGVAPAALPPSRYVIMTPEPLSELLENYADVEQRLRRAKFDHFLTEP